MRLVNINIGIKINNTNEIAKFLEEQKADIITIQENLRHLDESVFEPYKSQEGIEQAIGKSYPYKFFGPLWVTDKFIKDERLYRDFGGRVEQGNEIISKHPIVDATNEFYYKNFSYNFDITNWKQEDHGRAVQIAVLVIDGKKIQVLNLHGIWTEHKMGDERTIKQCRYIIEAAKRRELPTIIVGDFNLMPESKGIELMNNEFINLISEYKIASTRPDFNDGMDKGLHVVDYVFVSDKIKVNDFQVIETDISDHLPLMLDFEIIN